MNLVTPDTRSWFGLKMGDVTVSGGLDPSLGIQLSATIAIGALDYNSASSTNPRAGGEAPGLGERVRSGWRRGVR